MEENETAEPAGEPGIEAEETPGTEPVSEADAEAAFNEGAGIEGDPGSFEKETAPDPETPPGKEGTEKEPAAKGPEGDATPAGEKPVEKSPETKPTYDSLEKSLRDTQAWATRLAQDLAELKKAKAVDPAKAPAPESEIPKEVQEYYQDYPEAQKAVQYEAEKLVKKMFGNFDPNEVVSMKGQLAQAEFEKKVVTGFAGGDGQWVDGHPDAYRVMATPDFKAWFNSELSRDQNLGALSDPLGAIHVLTRYKSARAAAAAAIHDRKLNDKAGQMKEFASGTVKPGNAVTKTSKKDAESPEEIFDKFAS